MRKVKVLCVGLIVSILVPIVHLVILEATTSYKNSQHHTDTSAEIINIEGVGPVSPSNRATIYWYSYTVTDFLKEFLLSMIVYLMVLYVIQLLRKKRAL